MIEHSELRNPETRSAAAETRSVRAPPESLGIMWTYSSCLDSAWTLLGLLPYHLSQSYSHSGVLGGIPIFILHTSLNSSFSSFLFLNLFLVSCHY
ncbi:hypothetical protein PAXRUDRAFT_611904 [Paxillus rubicundulus Ve08.2h10]|uniref:Uncharacterized protein n=1 Tax=Paxillus rubicundulus Ve08.2h10 TaxID=930991 RepID=A0A0D0DKQ6_9AGAM|nr:hypothetical protein PAXRUDRAFT_611904 [Paxillus rubicundulus Ve08.2h10]